jgi:hypothetical protein
MTVDVRNGEKTFGSECAVFHLLRVCLFIRASTNVIRNLITIRGLNLKLQYYRYEIFHNTQSEVAN